MSSGLRVPSLRDGLYVAFNYNYLHGFRYENVDTAWRLDTDGTGLLTINAAGGAPAAVTPRPGAIALTLMVLALIRVGAIATDTDSASTDNRPCYLTVKGIVTVSGSGLLSTVSKLSTSKARPIWLPARSSSRSRASR